VQRTPAAPLILALCAVCLLTAVSCSDDPAGPGPAPDLERFWPHADGNSWRFAVKHSSETYMEPVLHDTPEEVPAIPSLEDAYDLLVAEPPGSPPALDLFFELTFSGMDTTGSGAIGQNLRETYYYPDQPIPVARPDWWRCFRTRLAGESPAPQPTVKSVPFVAMMSPLFLHGGVFVASASYIGTYGHLDQELAWQFLTDDLAVGTTFTFQLAPSLARDVFLHALIRRRFDLEIGGRTYRDCLECLYVIDDGLRQWTGELGDPLGYYRLFDVGTVVYAPGVGPVLSLERQGIDTSLENPLGWRSAEFVLLPSDVPEGPSGPLAPDLENVWPNTDGDAWRYRIDARFGDSDLLQMYEDPEDVPPLPSLSMLDGWLDLPAGFTDAPDSLSTYMELEFDGMRTTGSGATGQNLTETLFLPLGTGLTAQAGQPTRNLLRHLLRARPDLRTRAASLLPARLLPLSASKDADPWDTEPLFLFGYVWEKTEEYIGTYGDLDQELAWKFLEADLSPGHQFAHQLVPLLADDIWLLARVLPRRSYTVGGVTYQNCVEVLYVLDMGVQVLTNESGEILGATRSYGAARIVYAPRVGPVHCYERFLQAPDDVIQDPSWNLAEREVSLVQAKVAP
jgi:hypothetical protein